jgi:hypothetical protein
VPKSDQNFEADRRNPREDWAEALATAQANNDLGEFGELSNNFDVDEWTW